MYNLIIGHGFAAPFLVDCVVNYILPSGCVHVPIFFWTLYNFAKFIVPYLPIKWLIGDLTVWGAGSCVVILLDQPAKKDQHASSKKKPRLGV